MLKKEELVAEMLGQVDSKYRDEDMEKSIKCCVGLEGTGLVLSDTEEQEQAERFLTWARGMSLLKVITAEVQPGILTSGKAELIDIKVNARYGPDDKIYERNQAFRKKVARGNSFLHITSGPHTSLFCIIYALKKFTGGLGDDDDRDRGDNFTWKKYFTKPMDEAVEIVATKKANGEAAHFSVRRIGDRTVMCGGSKNVHMLFRSKGDIEKYSDSRYQVARDVCLAIWNMLQKMTEDCRKRLFSFLCHSHFTAVFELLRPTCQHVEDLSYLKESELKFITWTTSVLEPDEDCDTQLCTVNPHIAIQIARALGLPTVDYEIIESSRVDERMQAVRRGYQYEGEVFYFIDSNKTVIGLLKKKTIWYIIVRAVREKIRSACNSYDKGVNFNISQHTRKINSRLNEIQQWLGLDDDSTENWKCLGTGFLEWTIERMKSGKLKKDDVANIFPVVWKRFLSETGQSDQVSYIWKETEESDD